MPDHTQTDAGDGAGPGPAEPGLEEPAWLASAGPQVQHMYRYWSAKSRNGRLPLRADIDPVEIPRLLSHLILVEVVPDARRYVYRLVGTKEVEIRGRDPTGQSVIEGFLGPSIEDVLFWYDSTVQQRAPQYDDRPYVSTDGRWVSDESLFLPLCDDGIHINRVLVFTASSPNKRSFRKT